MCMNSKLTSYLKRFLEILLFRIFNLLLSLFIFIRIKDLLSSNQTESITTSMPLSNYSSERVSSFMLAFKDSVLLFKVLPQGSHSFCLG